MPAWAVTLIAKLMGLIFSKGKDAKAESDKQRADAAEKTIGSVNDSLKVEKEVRDAHKEVDKNPTDVTADDGGASFGDFNSGK